MSDRSVFIVYNVLGSPPSGYHSLIMQNGYPYYQLYCTANSTWQYYFGGGINATNSCSAGQGAKLIEVVSSATVSSVYVNSAQTGTTASPDSAVTAAFMIGSYNLNNGLNGDIAEILVYNTALSTADRQTIENYLNQKYGLY